MNRSRGQILNQGRGEKVEVVLEQSSTTQPGTNTEHQQKLALDAYLSKLNVG